MIRYEVIGCPIASKNKLKNILPKTQSKWRWDGKKWVLTIQINQNTKKFQKELSLFVNKVNGKMTIHEWNGFNKKNNY